MKYREFQKIIEKMEISDKRNFQNHLTRFYVIYEYLDRVITKNCKILDIGCGRGQFYDVLKNISSLPVRYTGLYADTEEIKTCIQKGYDVRFCDVTKEVFPFENSYFDIIFCGEILEHIENPNNLFKEMERTLKSGGILILTTPNYASLRNRLMFLVGENPLPCPYLNTKGKTHQTHVREYTYREIDNLFNIYNFKLIHKLRIHYFNKNKIKQLAQSIICKLSPNLSSQFIMIGRRIK